MVIIFSVERAFTPVVWSANTMVNIYNTCINSKGAINVLQFLESMTGPVRTVVDCDKPVAQSVNTDAWLKWLH